MATRRLPILAGLVFTLTLGGGALFLHQSDRPVPPAHAAPTPARAGIAVETAAAAQDRVVEDIREFGTLVRSEEHTSELQSLMRLSYAVFCLKTKTKCNNVRR